MLVVARREERLLSLCQELTAAYEASIPLSSLDVTAPGASQALYQEAVRFSGKSTCWSTMRDEPLPGVPRLELQPSLPVLA